MKRFVHISDGESPKTSKQDQYCDNRISNRKYTLLNFLPKNLMEQFSRFMNQYFLLIACLQLWPLITPVNPASTWGPLIFIFSVSATKEAWDDYNRYMSDKKANEKQVWVVKHGIKGHIQAQDIHVGNIVWLRENDEVPCDLVLVGSSDSQGLCYIETSALDGEIDLKRRVVPSTCMGIDIKLLHKIRGVIECPKPDKDIRRFDANLRLFPPFIDNDVCPLTINNTVLQSCYLRNTEWACGVAVYTGNETKLGMSRGVPEPKLTAMDVMIDKLTGAIFIFQIVVVIVLGISGNIWKDTEGRKQWYLSYPREGLWYELLVIPLRFELLSSIMIPISVKVSLDLVKSLYAKFIDWDMWMIDHETCTPPHAANTAISEDLGQIECILTDKTGTLTENMMVFKRCFVNGIFYGNESGDALNDVLLRNAIHNGSFDIRFLLVMAICNTVVPVKSKTGGVFYRAQSQDEEALVSAAAKLHMLLANKNGNIVDVRFNSLLIQYEIMEILKFTSDRKRMSVVVRDCQSGMLFLMSKGADDAILPFASSGQPTRIFYEAVEQYAQMGLRTLCLAWRDVLEEEFKQWSGMFREASSSVADREWRVAEVCQRLEHDLEVLGVSAIEDRLQDGVPETIETLRKAGINFWMLTGDRQSTAIQIAISCNFVSPEPRGQLLLINGKNDDEIFGCLDRVLHTIKVSTSEIRDVAFVIDGGALEIALRNHGKAFTELASLSRTAICCRMTPSQKAQIVELLKSCDYRTLAIGDGGNDVRMIQQADVGVGISGKEGLQASRAADYSIGKFKFLKRLILVHGRYSYNRTAFLSQYSFYKSLLICFIQIFFSFISGLSGTSLFNSVSLMAYNVFYTSIPVLVSVLDKDLSEETVIQHPQILFYCQAGRLLNPSTFAGWFGRSLFHAVVVLLVSVHACPSENCELEEVAMVALSGCMWLQAIVVTLETNSFTALQLLAIYGNLIAFYVINWIFSAIPSSGMHAVMFQLCRQPSYWVTMLLIVGAGVGPTVAVKYFRYTYFPSKINILQQGERMGGPIFSLGNIAPQPKIAMEKEKALPQLSSIAQANKNRSPAVSEPLLSGSPNYGPHDFFPPQPRAAAPANSYSRNCKDN